MPTAISTLSNGESGSDCRTSLNQAIAVLNLETDAGRSMTQAANAAAQSALLGLGTIATQAASAVAITGGTIAGLTGLAIRDTSAAFDVTLAATSSTTLTAGRTLTVDVGNVAHILTLGTTASTGSGIIFPNTATDTVAMLATANAFTAAQSIASTLNVSTVVTGSELATVWTNNATFPFETFTVSNPNITSAINSSGYGIGTMPLATTQGVRYRVTFTLTLNSGTGPYFGIYTTTNIPGGATGTIRAPIVCAGGANTYEFTANSTATNYLTFWNDTGVATNFSVASFTCKALTAGVTGNQFSCVQNSTSEVFGYGADTKTFGQSFVAGRNATAAQADSVVLGFGASGTTGTAVLYTYGGTPVIVGSQATGCGVALGYKAQATNYEAVAVGPQCQASGLATVAIGDGCRALPSAGTGNEWLVGDVLWATGNWNAIFGGGGCGTAKDFVVAFGAYGASTAYDKEIATANHQGFFGWYQTDATIPASGVGIINDWFLGGPVTATAPHAITLNITGGSGTNQVGVDFTINGARGTGSGAGGNLIFATAPAGSTGTTAGTLATVLTITPTAIVTLASGAVLKLGNAAASAVAVASTNTITVQDSTGTTYKLLCTT